LPALARQTAAQSQNPTPIVITIPPQGTPTPDGGATAVPEAGSGLLPPDRFEPNNDESTATPIGLQIEPDLTLTGDDRDFFTGYLKAGQMVRISTTVAGGLDTRLKLYWNGQLAVDNDDRSAVDVGSTVTFSAPADGWYVVMVEKATVYDGIYELETALTEPVVTPTLTPGPTLTPTPSPTPLIPPDQAEPNDTPETAWPVTPGVRGTYTIGAGDVDAFTFIAKAGSRYACEVVTDQVDTLLTVISDSAVIGVNDDRGAGRVDSYLEWVTDEEQPVVVKVEARGGSFGQYEFGCQQVVVSPAPMSPAPVENAPGVGDSSTVGEPSTPTVPMTAAERISLTVQYVGRVQPQTSAPATHIRLLVYYDANNDRQPGPGEGVANVSILAVNAQGQRIARVFTNPQGEAIFNLAGEAIARVIVPFVPGWSARIKAGEVNNDIVLGLPAVRLPVFLPVQNRMDEEVTR